MKKTDSTNYLLSRFDLPWYHALRAWLTIHSELFFLCSSSSETDPFWFNMSDSESNNSQTRIGSSINQDDLTFLIANLLRNELNLNHKQHKDLTQTITIRPATLSRSRICGGSEWGRQDPPYPRSGNQWNQDIIGHQRRTNSNRWRDTNPDSRKRHQGFLIGMSVRANRKKRWFLIPNGQKQNEMHLLQNEEAHEGNLLQIGRLPRLVGG